MKMLSALLLSAGLVALGWYLDRRGISIAGGLSSILVSAWKLTRPAKERVVYLPPSREAHWSDGPGWSTRWPNQDG